MVGPAAASTPPFIQVEMGLLHAIIALQLPPSQRAVLDLLLSELLGPPSPAQQLGVDTSGARLAAALGLHPRTVEQAVLALSARGVLVRRPHERGHGHLRFHVRHPSAWGLATPIRAMQPPATLPGWEGPMLAPRGANVAGGEPSGQTGPRGRPRLRVIDAEQADPEDCGTWDRVGAPGRGLGADGEHGAEVERLRAAVGWTGGWPAEPPAGFGLAAGVGLVAGSASGLCAGGASGGLAGPASSVYAGGASSDFAGGASGQLAGPASSGFAGGASTASSQLAGPASGQLAGPAPGQRAGATPGVEAGAAPAAAPGVTRARLSKRIEDQFSTQLINLDEEKAGGGPVGAPTAAPRPADGGRGPERPAGETWRYTVNVRGARVPLPALVEPAADRLVPDWRGAPRRRWAELKQIAELLQADHGCDWNPSVIQRALNDLLAGPPTTVGGGGETKRGHEDDAQDVVLGAVGGPLEAPGQAGAPAGAQRAQTAASERSVADRPDVGAMTAPHARPAGGEPRTQPRQEPAEERAAKTASSPSVSAGVPRGAANGSAAAAGTDDAPAGSEELAMAQLFADLRYASPACGPLRAALEAAADGQPVGRRALSALLAALG